MTWPSKQSSADKLLLQTQFEALFNKIEKLDIPPANLDRIHTKLKLLFHNMTSKQDHVSSKAKLHLNNLTKLSKIKNLVNAHSL